MESIPKFFSIIPAAIVWVMPPVGSFHFDENTTITFFGCPLHVSIFAIFNPIFHGNYVKIQKLNWVVRKLVELFVIKLSNQF